MKNTRQRLPTARIALLFALFIGTGSDAATLPEEASFYAAKIEPVFDKLATFVYRMNDCARQLGAACDEHALPNLDYSLKVIDTITIFNPDGLRYHANDIRDEKEFWQLIQNEKAELLSLIQTYEEELIARLVAISVVCRESSVEYLALLQRFDFIRVWGMPEEQVKLAFQRIADIENSLIPEIRKWPRERCVATRAFGEPLVALLKDKMEPYKRKDSPVATRNQRFGSGASLVVGVALVLQSSVDPDVLSRVQPE